MEQTRQYVGIDLHRRRSVIVRRTPEGDTLDTVRIDNDPLALAAELAKAGEHPEVVLEIAGVAALELRNSLGDQVEMPHREPALRRFPAAPFLPALRNRDEQIGRGQLDVDLQFLLQHGNGAEDLGRVRHQLQVHVDRALAPAEQDRRRPTGEIHGDRRAGLPTEPGQQTSDAVGRR